MRLGARRLAVTAGVLAVAEVYLATTGRLGMNAGIALLVATPFAAVWASRDGVRAAACPGRGSAMATRELVLALECLVVGSADALAGARVSPVVAAAGAAALACVQSIILLFVLRNPSTLRAAGPPSSVNKLSVRRTVGSIFYVALVILACAVFIPRTTGASPRTIPVELQWPAIALLYATFGCLALGLASEHARAATSFYVAASLVIASSVSMELIGRRNLYYLGLTLLAFLCLVSAWPTPAQRDLAGPPLTEAARPGG